MGEMTRSLHILVVAATEEAAAPLIRAVARAGFTPAPVVAATEAAYVARLDASLDVILAMTHVPGLSAGRALALVRERGLDVPLIVVAEPEDEAIIASLLRQGADDCVFSDRLVRLGSAVSHALASRQLRAEKRHAERALVEAEAQFAAFMEQVNAAAFIKDAQGRLLFANTYLKERFAPAALASPGDGEANPLFETLRQNDRRALREGPTVEIERVPDPAGEIHTYETRRFPIPRDGAPPLLGGIAIDITDRVTMDENLHVMVSAVEQGPDIIFITDRAGRIIYANQNFTAVEGYPVEEAMGRIPRVLDADALSPEEYRARWDAILAGREWQGELLSHKKTGEPYWEHVSISPIRNAAGEITNFFLIKEDITERKRAEQTLQRLHQASQQLSRTLDLETIYSTLHDIVREEMPCDGFFVSSFSPEDNLIRCVCAWNEDTRIDISQLPPIPLEPEGQGTQSVAIRTGQSLYLPDFEAHRKAAATSYFVSEDGEVVETLPEEEDRPRAALIVPLKLADQVIGVIQVFSFRLNDFTEDNLRFLESLASLASAALVNARLFQQTQQEIVERRRAEEAEREQRVLAEALSEAARVLNSTLDLDDVLDAILISVGRVLPYDGVNIMLLDEGRIRIVRHRGYAERGLGDWLESINWSLDDVGNLREMAETGQPLAIPRRREYPGWVDFPEARWLNAYAGAPICAGGKVIGFLNVDSATEGLYTQEHAGRLMAFADHAALAIRNAQLHEAVQQHAAELEARVAERTAQLREREEQARAQFRGVPLPTYTWQRTDDGDFVLVDYNDAALEETQGGAARILGIRLSEFFKNDPEIYTAVNACYDTHMPTECELYYTYKTTGQRRYLKMRFAFVPPDLVLAHTIDLTDRRKAEEALQAALEQEKRLGELRSHFVATVSHEFRTPLAIINSSTEILRFYGHKLTESEKLKRMDRIRDAISRMVTLLDDVLLMNKAESGKLSFNPAPVDVVALCRNVVEDMVSLAGTGVEFSFVNDVDSLIAEVDENLMRLIIDNLVSNAIKYSPAGGAVTVDLRRDGDQLILKVQDTGIGIPERNQPHIFESFFRGENAGEAPGTGLGLTITREAVERHGGTITFESEAGQGTVFTVTIPLAHDQDGD